MQDYIDKNQVEISPETPVNESRTFYLPHHVVKKQKNNNAKYRIVFDGSSHSPGHQSLNEVLEQGPNLLPEILATLLRFRRHKQAIICDGSQAFLQLTLSEKDRDDPIEGIQIVGKQSSATVQQKYFTIRHHHSGDIVQDLRTQRIIFQEAFLQPNSRRWIFGGMELTSDEIENAKDYWILVVQKQCFHVEIKALEKSTPLPAKSKIARFNPFLQDDISRFFHLRLGGRLQFAQVTSEEKHPLLLDGSHHFVQLLIRHTHVRLHHLGVRIILSELRSNYWILRGREAKKRVIHGCLLCRLSKAPRGTQIEAPLPAENVTPCIPFSTTGIDFAGPLYVRNSKSLDTAYIPLFTCSTTRALHIELVSDLTTDKFLMALQRFVGRRGLPHTIYTDNATTFHAANRELISLWNNLASTKIQQFYAINGIKWKFIVPRAAWWGGWWERLVGLTKQCLRKSLGRALLDEEGLQTALIGIEAAFSSRPLVYEQENDSDEILTPSLDSFLTDKKLTLVPSDPEQKITNLSRNYRIQQDLLDTFWRKWSREYLLQLSTFHQVHNSGKSSHVQEGYVVLLHEN
ncbi:hypothetical protein AVEN_124034-1 [Araneus ventricosus]|uniref:Integrase catalytic domain-containing protein n=1 Tax=Araneus ventricosus TaxID=182803 RepID=A0A4Y2PZX9_ARAVE|nr:hypothetical protein AVEN_124034-1 [Araneus ventricosus]